MNSKELRKTFFDFFKSKEHQIVTSAPMVVKNDPTLMFTNPANITIWKRLVTTPTIIQCLRCSATGHLATILRKRP